MLRKKISRRIELKVDILPDVVYQAQPREQALHTYWCLCERHMFSFRYLKNTRCAVGAACPVCETRYRFQSWKDGNVEVKVVEHGL